jgi:AraC family transcriptional regulator
VSVLNSSRVELEPQNTTRDHEGCMFLTDYTAITRIGRSLDAPHPNGWMNLLLHARGDAQQIPLHTTSLSLYSVFRGSERHEVNRARFAVTPDRYLLLNDNQRHTHGIEDNTEVLSLRFRTGMGSDVYTAATLPLDKQLENPNERVPLEFFERTYPRDARLSELLGWLRIFIWAEVTQDPLEQAMQPILERLLVLHRNLDAEIEAQPAAKRSTREELFRRLHIARDYIEASYLEKINLFTIADIANLSPHHFLRVFKQSFEITPYQFVTQKRLELAQKWLRETEKDVTDICFDLGFESLGTFSRSFKARFLVSPSQYRTNALTKSKT